MTALPLRAPHKARLDFILRFREQFPAEDREACIKAGNKLLRLAKAYKKHTSDLAAGQLSVVRARRPSAVEYWRGNLTQEIAKVEARCRDHCREWGITPHFADTIEVRFPALAYFVPIPS